MGQQAFDEGSHGFPRYPFCCSTITASVSTINPGSHTTIPINLFQAEVELLRQNPFQLESVGVFRLGKEAPPSRTLNVPKSVILRRTENTHLGPPLQYGRYLRVSGPGPTMRISPAKTLKSVGTSSSSNRD